MVAEGNSKHRVIHDRLSEPRMARYVTEADGDHARALEIYSRQAKVSAALWLTIGHVEVVVRNAMHDQLSRHSAAWYDSLSVVLSETARDDIAETRKRLEKRRIDETPGQIVADLSFGFWRFLLSKHYDRSLWVPYLNAAFPNFKGGRGQLYSRMVSLNDARNAIAHHQRVDSPRQVRTTALEVAGYVCKDTGAWVQSECGVLAALG
ncbi:hypothetical protein [Janibacter sp. G1551]|uniref:hypothetical protein n=1 Tax=Janibacter sp. G1551 TaxID=3420440 RepID=UPI003D066AE0